VLPQQISNFNCAYTIIHCCLASRWSAILKSLGSRVELDIQRLYPRIILKIPVDDPYWFSDPKVKRCSSVHFMKIGIFSISLGVFSWYWYFCIGWSLVFETKIFRSFNFSFNVRFSIGWKIVVILCHHEKIYLWRKCWNISEYILKRHRI
jgi:hypothetical protein